MSADDCAGGAARDAGVGNERVILLQNPSEDLFQSLKDAGHPVVAVLTPTAPYIVCHGERTPQRLFFKTGNMPHANLKINSTGKAFYQALRHLDTSNGGVSYAYFHHLGNTYGLDHLDITVAKKNSSRHVQPSKKSDFTDLVLRCQVKVTYQYDLPLLGSEKKISLESSQDDIRESGVEGRKKKPSSGRKSKRVASRKKKPSSGRKSKRAAKSSTSAVLEKRAKKSSSNPEEESTTHAAVVARKMSNRTNVSESKKDVDETESGGGKKSDIGTKNNSKLSIEEICNALNAAVGVVPEGLTVCPEVMQKLLAAHAEAETQKQASSNTDLATARPHTEARATTRDVASSTSTPHPSIEGHQNSSDSSSLAASSDEEDEDLRDDVF